jgi:nicotinamide mononucleotide transporter
VVATYMVAKKLIENWIYWFVIDFISVFLFLSRDLFLTALLFVGYLVIIIFGYRAWKLSMLETKKGINNK